MNTNHGIQTRTRFVHRVSKLKEPRKQHSYSKNLWAAYTGVRFDKRQADRLAKYLTRCEKGAQ